jgi:hypothetical protein
LNVDLDVAAAVSSWLIGPQNCLHPHGQKFLFWLEIS